jgi:hypothetical protein
MPRGHWAFSDPAVALTREWLACCRFTFDNVIQGAGYLIAQLDKGNKDKYSQPMRTVMDVWLGANSGITYTPKVSHEARGPVHGAWGPLSRPCFRDGHALDWLCTLISRT